MSEKLLELAPVVPVVVLDDAGAAVPLARALVDGGLPVIEVTLRTPAATEAVRRIAAEVPGAVVGTGTVRTPADVTASVAAGARFLVSPGATPRLLDAMEDSGLDLLPGTSSISEMLAVAERGHTAMKFFPAEAAGGRPFLKSVAGPLPDLRFCPTGGITPASAPDYLALPNVSCVGGSWLTPADLVAAGDFGRIRDLAAEAAALGGGR
ncbi:MULTISPECIES: bifunctional 4-hydroxy-2-oxoglutarate aldolase/2-dehydro-3-deoxy-phosphogluconate aldolase [unclassified Pseudonocardia]|uniref:bifunctional 4-hydroxy-2-oxoglutarate aldolase/2-dehydro-3-deoxy-phosphogluconate aldolase n=1 Tax=unclassified Pseudonocardia TaxID=2619320 RepID=UPI0006CB10BB|nr:MULTISPECIES: bifunctional 4-hydroxy-2-oxoglutarate aldolase/2-dehydro-3-deoxy-phosphogluconate aldolase [unclassified Pseudonocardia]ALE73404.1 keto-deoxy-phosphogluconate aldolase [Pseudonocardia sp. EC080625-04]ALL77082.1 keto-deoxy-phosphogluconate aldolase [Pseudonocardia sp. EC080610-09]ALL84113.1 keto-deoxy-phosphogluconate aldolase [Pseudonocardia sp. EC080619-01]OLM18422.1 4-Hydroxy-2-oxoglutarate aldolase, 2-dehydro-3-deoxyphosphogluconate aldolase [Pseudonocardia sp. Ae707_Ps1]